MNSALELPSARFAGAGHHRNISIDSQLSDDGEKSEDNGRKTPVVEAEPQEGLDYVLFDGEEEEQTIAEIQWSQKVQQAGKLRRAKTRQRYNTGKRQRPERFRSNPNSAASSPVKARFSLADLRPTSFLPITISEQQPYAEEDNLINAYLQDSPSDEKKDPFLVSAGHLPSYRVHKSTPSFTPSLALSVQPLINTTAGSPNSSPFRDETEDLFLDVSEAEMEDLHIISELARTGHPDIAKIMDEEQERAEGKIIVACKYCTSSQ